MVLVYQAAVNYQMAIGILRVVDFERGRLTVGPFVPIHPSIRQ
jgi:hypothetical protein